MQASTKTHLEIFYKELNSCITCTKDKSKSGAFWNVSQHHTFLLWAVNISLNRQTGGPPLFWCPPLFIQYIRCCRPSSVRKLRTRHAVVAGKSIFRTTEAKYHWIRKLNKQNNVLDKQRRTVRYSRIYSKKFPASGASNVSKPRMTSQVGECTKWCVCRSVCICSQSGGGTSSRLLT